MQRESWLQDLGQDARIGLRSLLRVPMLLTAVVATVGLGIGATTAMFAVVDATLLRPLPYADPDRLFRIYTDNPPFRFRFSVVDYRALEADHPSFTSVAAYQTSQVTVSGSYFPLLGQKPHLGRLFDPSDDDRGEPLAVVTHAYWRRRFAAEAQPGRDAARGVKKTSGFILRKT